MDAFAQLAELVGALDVIERRDDVIRAAYAAGYSKSELHRLTGLARTTINRILAEVPK